MTTRRIVGRGMEIGGLYYLNTDYALDRVQSTTATVSVFPFSVDAIHDTCRLWHAKLGHAFLSILLPVEMNCFSTKICLMAIIFNADDYLYINCGGEKAPINGSIYEADTQRHGASTFYLSPNKNWGYSSMGEISSESSYIVNRTFDPSMVNMALYSTARISPLISEILWILFEEWKLHQFYKEFPAAVSDHLLEIHFYWAGKGSVSNAQQPGPLISAIATKKNMSLDSVQKSGKLSGVIIAGIAGSAVFLLVLVLVIIWKMGCLGVIKLPSDELKYLELFPEGFFNFRQIKVATQNFSSANKIGEGGFGPVYKGVLQNGVAIAVKQLSPKSKQCVCEFVNEIGTISALQHPNLVRLLGCCTEENQLLIVYEYMENNSLARMLYLVKTCTSLFCPEEFRSRLNWPTRVKICLGIAKGLAFLHEESKLKIVHRDVKPANVLLDKDLNAKISDFGFAKLYEGEKTHVITRIAGTNGYMAPEYATRGYLTNKADVYSFGVLYLKLSGKNSMKYKPKAESVYLLDLAYDLQEKGNLIALIDPILGYDYSMKEALTLLELAMLCTNPSPTVSPTMSEVVRILEGKTQMKAPPLHAPYSADNFVRAKAMADIPLSIQSGGTFREGTSNTFSSLVVGKEGEECNVTVDYSPEISEDT
ncbi:hypothetical protein HHK36_023484 [Tetracentron sinense]|uniref:Protein kinase domain-containing protein n=1 Tax=Tetracentron sinense TaxID=13715 RepID=A0A835D5F8_TETSI|nr:hypothetical protein HHK36_023484 [Tetracentron sinense]